MNESLKQDLKDNSLESFRQKILDEAQKSRDQVIKEQEAIKEKELYEIEIEALQRAYEQIQIEIGNNNRSTRIQVADKIAVGKEELLKKREELVDKIFAEIKKKVVAFTQSPKYKAWLINKLQEAKKYNANIMVYLNEQDKKKFEKDLLEAGAAEVHQMKEEFGGMQLRFQGKNIIVNNTLSERINDARHSFTGLKIDE